jgi:hypothetical protein
VIEKILRHCGLIDKTFKYEGIVIDRSLWGSQKMFCIAQNEPSGATFVTEAAKDLLEAQEFTNLAFREAGRITGA